MCGFVRGRIELIDTADVRAGDQMAIDIDCNLDRTVTHLLLDIGQGRAALNQQ